MHRNLLIAELLDGNREAIRILADLIEEEGEEQLAAQTRQRKLSDRKLLKLALDLLDCRLGAELIVDFAEHAVAYGPPQPEFQGTLDALRRWSTAGGESTHQERLAELNQVQLLLEQRADDFRARRSQRDYQLFSLDRIELFNTLVLALAQLDMAEQGGDDRQLKRKRNRVRSHLTIVARDLQNWPTLLHPLRMQVRRVRFPYPAEQLAWQLDHIRKTLREGEALR